jgi:hypothetical protein
MGLRPTHRDGGQTFVTPAQAGGGPRRQKELDSRFRGNDVTFDAAFIAEKRVTVMSETATVWTPCGDQGWTVPRAFWAR